MSYPKELYTMLYGDLLHTMREDRGLTTAELAKATGSTQNNIEAWEAKTMAPWQPGAKFHAKAKEALSDDNDLLGSLVELERETITIPLKQMPFEVREMIKIIKVNIENGKVPSPEEAIQIVQFLLSDEEVA